jgi:hypothetical protein
MNVDKSDLLLWSEAQSELLRQGSVSELDLPGLIKHLKTFGEDIRRDALRTMRVLLECQLRLSYGPAGEQRIAQKVSVTRRKRLGGSLRQAPSIRPWLEKNLQDAWQRVRQSKIDRYLACGITVCVIPAACPWAFKQLLSAHFCLVNTRC